MIRTVLTMAVLLFFSSAPLSADHNHNRRPSGFSAFFSFGNGRQHQPRRYRGNHYSDRRYYGNRYYDGGGYYDGRRRFHKHERKHYRKYQQRRRNHRRNRHYDYCPYH